MVGHQKEKPTHISSSKIELSKDPLKPRKDE